MTEPGIQQIDPLGIFFFFNTYSSSAQTAINVSDCSMLQDAAGHLGRTSDLRRCRREIWKATKPLLGWMLLQSKLMTVVSFFL